MKKAFTIIELIFVIVILGILSTVALPKFIGVANEAHEANLKSFVGTLNRTVGPVLWSKSFTEGRNGAIRDLDINLSLYTDIPKELRDINNSCGENTYNVIGEANVSVAGYVYKIVCKDGNATNAPTFGLKKDDNCIAGRCE